MTLSGSHVTVEPRILRPSDDDLNACRRDRLWSVVLITATVMNCAFQIAWVWRFRWRNITMDGINYIGLARHLVDGNFKASLHGYWSPLTSWIIAAAAAVFGGNFTLIGRLVTITSFLLCLPLLYYLTLRLWHSRTAAGLSMFWFSAARGVLESSVGSILADFVLTAAVLLYFTLLLDALRQNKRSTWTMLGAVHGLAFLAKAIAMPWLTISSAAAVLLRNARSPRRVGVSLLLTFLFPAIVWVSWGTTLRIKYGVFTSGYQLRANLMTNWRRWQNHTLRGDNLTFEEFPSLYDNYMVAETSFTSIRSFTLRNLKMLPMIVTSLIRNLPQAVKETVILLTPAGALAFPLMLVLLIRSRSRFENEIAFAAIGLLSTLSLITAYCILVFDTRYVVPIVPILFAIACPVLLPANLVPHAAHASSWLQKAGLGLFAASIMFFAVYWASPFRTVDRDFEVSCYQAASILRNAKPIGTLVSLGSGPYPEHGVGFEAAPYVAYLAGWRVIGGNSELPHSSGVDELAHKALAARADAVVVWGSPGNLSYAQIVNEIKQAPALLSADTFSDPFKGEVGTLFLFQSKN